MNKKYRKTVIAGNWKMNMTASDVREFMSRLSAATPDNKTCDAVLCVPFPLIPALIKPAKQARLGIGAQNVSEYGKGAYTGEVNAEMLSDLGVKYAIAGHSERRQFFSEDDAAVNRKTLNLLDHGITPIICVGESGLQRDRGLTMEHIAYQVKSALYAVTEDKARRCIIAYEPIWAIGTGNTATTAQAQEVCEYIRSVARQMYGARIARSMSILYGGSMNAQNAAELLSMPDIDGGLIGGASLDPGAFARIIADAGQELTRETSSNLL